MDELLGEVRARGHRMTPQRQLIFETVYTAKKHLTAEEIHERVRKRFRGVTFRRSIATLICSRIWD